MPDNRNNKGYYRPEQDRRPQGQNRPQQQESSTWLTPTVKGIIAILLTVLVVAIVIMIFAKTLFEHQHHSEKDRYDNFYGIHSAKDHHHFGRAAENI